MPQITLKVNVDCYGWNALAVNGFDESEVIDRMEEVAFQELKALREENGVDED